jgi:hypothetical protein
VEVNVPTVVAEEVAANIPERVTESPLAEGVRIVPFLSQKLRSTTPLEVMSPVHDRFPVAPSTVHPVAAAPPARLMEVAVLLPGPILIVEPAPKALTVVALVLKRLSIPVADVVRV